jgi:hypothetical protein
MSRYIHQRFFMNPSEAEMFSNYKASAISFEIIRAPDRAEVCVRHTLCSKKDAFCRASAREALSKKPWETMRIVDLPIYMERIYKKAIGRKKIVVDRVRAEQSYAWVWKYFV